jgi:hypothetical protein
MKRCWLLFVASVLFRVARSLAILEAMPEGRHAATSPKLLDTGLQVPPVYRIPGCPSSVFDDGEGIIRVIPIGLMTVSQLDGYLAEAGIKF